MGTYSLIPGIENRTKINVCTRRKGYLQYSYAVLDPGVEYELPEDDPAFVESLKKETYTKHWSQAIEDKLKSMGIPYEVKNCKQCGGRVKKIIYHPVEVHE